MSIHVFSQTENIITFGNTAGVLIFNSNSISQSVTVYLSTVYAHYRIHDPTVIAGADISVEFVGVPRNGSSPLIVDFTATVTLEGGENGGYLIDKYLWYFDYDNNPTVYETSDTNTIEHIYSGYYGQQFSVKLSVLLK